MKKNVLDLNQCEESLRTLFAKEMCRDCRREYLTIKNGIMNIKNPCAELNCVIDFFKPHLMSDVMKDVNVVLGYDFRNEECRGFLFYRVMLLIEKGIVEYGIGVYKRINIYNESISVHSFRPMNWIERYISFESLFK